MMSLGTWGGDHEITMPSSSAFACRDLTAPKAREEKKCGYIYMYNCGLYYNIILQYENITH